jgi:hypothetical protein
MSVASGFRSKWSVILKAADASIGQSDDARFAAMAKATSDADLILTERSVVVAYQKTIEDLRATVRGELTEQAQKLDMGY